MKTLILSYLLFVQALISQDPSQVQEELASLYNDAGYSKAHSIDAKGQEVISDFNGNLSYVYSIPPYQISEKSAIDIKMTYTNNLSMYISTNGPNHLGKTKGEAVSRQRYNDINRQFATVNMPAWILSVNGVTVQVSNFENNYISLRDSGSVEPLSSGHNISFLVNGYNFPFIQDHDELNRAVLKVQILQGDGSMESFYYPSNSLVQNNVYFNNVNSGSTSTLVFKGDEKGKHLLLQRGDGSIIKYTRWQYKTTYLDEFGNVNVNDTTTRSLFTYIPSELQTIDGQRIEFLYEEQVKYSIHPRLRGLLINRTEYFNIIADKGGVLVENKFGAGEYSFTYKTGINDLQLQDHKLVQSIKDPLGREILFDYYDEKNNPFNVKFTNLAYTEEDQAYEFNITTRTPLRSIKYFNGQKSTFSYQIWENGNNVISMTDNTDFTHIYPSGRDKRTTAILSKVSRYVNRENNFPFMETNYVFSHNYTTPVLNYYTEKVTNYFELDSLTNPNHFEFNDHTAQSIKSTKTNFHYFQNETWFNYTNFSYKRTYNNLIKKDVFVNDYKRISETFEYKRQIPVSHIVKQFGTPVNGIIVDSIISKSVKNITFLDETEKYSNIQTISDIVVRTVDEQNFEYSNGVFLSVGDSIVTEYDLSLLETFSTNVERYRSFYKPNIPIEIKYYANGRLSSKELFYYSKPLAIFNNHLNIQRSIFTLVDSTNYRTSEREDVITNLDYNYDHFYGFSFGGMLLGEITYMLPLKNSDERPSSVASDSLIFVWKEDILSSSLKFIKPDSVDQLLLLFAVSRNNDFSDYYAPYPTKSLKLKNLNTSSETSIVIDSIYSGVLDGSAFKPTVLTIDLTSYASGDSLQLTSADESNYYISNVKLTRSNGIINDYWYDNISIADKAINYIHFDSLTNVRNSFSQLRANISVNYSYSTEDVILDSLVFIKSIYDYNSEISPSIRRVYKSNGLNTHFAYGSSSDKNKGALQAFFDSGLDESELGLGGVTVKKLDYNNNVSLSSYLQHAKYRIGSVIREINTSRFDTLHFFYNPSNRKLVGISSGNDYLQSLNLDKIGRLKELTLPGMFTSDSSYAFKSYVPYYYGAANYSLTSFNTNPNSQALGEESKHPLNSGTSIIYERGFRRDLSDGSSKYTIGREVRVMEFKIGDIIPNSYFVPEILDSLSLNIFTEVRPLSLYNFNSQYSSPSFKISLTVYEDSTKNEFTKKYSKIVLVDSLEEFISYANNLPMVYANPDLNDVAIIKLYFPSKVDADLNEMSMATYNYAYTAESKVGIENIALQYHGYWPSYSQRYEYIDRTVYTNEHLAGRVTETLINPVGHHAYVDTVLITPLGSPYKMSRGVRNDLIDSHYRTSYVKTRLDGSADVVSDVLGNITKTNYNIVDEAVGITNPDNSATSTFYKYISLTDFALETSYNIDSIAFKTPQAHTIIKTSATDENGNTTYTYKDNVGLLRATKNDTQEVHYVYDPLDRLSQVIHPTDATNKDTTFYTYNFLGQLIEKRVPRAGRSRFIYDYLGRVRFSQSELQRSTLNEISFTRYDQAGRVLVQGVLPSTSVIWDSLNVNYSNKIETNYHSLESDTAYALIINTYDELPNWMGASFISDQYSLGKLTATKSRSKLNEEFTIEYFEYDALGKATKYKKHEPDLASWYTETYAYDNLMRLREKQTSLAQTNFSILTIDSMEYDLFGRLIKVKSGSSKSLLKTLTEYSYSVRDEVITNKLLEGFQVTYFEYNSRGWLKSINDLQFKLHSLIIRYTCICMNMNTIAIIKICCCYSYS
jgi:hypothetical protein